MIERVASCEDVSLREKEWKQNRLLVGVRGGRLYFFWTSPCWVTCWPGEIFKQLNSLLCLLSLVVSVAESIRLKSNIYAFLSLLCLVIIVYWWYLPTFSFWSFCFELKWMLYNLFFKASNGPSFEKCFS